MNLNIWLKKISALPIVEQFFKTSFYLLASETVKCEHLGILDIPGCIFRGQSREVTQIRSLDSFVLWLIKWLINPMTCQLAATSINRYNWVFDHICPTLQWRSRRSAGPQALREVMGSEEGEEDSVEVSALLIQIY